MQPNPTNSIVQNKGRGRPRTIPSKPKVFRLAFSFEDAEKLSATIANKLGVAHSEFTYDLAHIALAYGPMRDLQRLGKIKKGCTRRSKIHLVLLLRDVACMYAKHTNSDAKKELRKINGYREERRIDAAIPLDNYPPVEILARIVMAMWGDEKEAERKSLNRQARVAVELI